MPPKKRLYSLNYQGFLPAVASSVFWYIPVHSNGAERLEISLMETSRGFESHPLRHVGASVISLAPTFFKSQSALILLLLLSKPDPLRWAPVWF